MLRSRLRTPASRVYSLTTLSIAPSVKRTRSAVSPCASSCAGTRWSRAIARLSFSVYPGSSITSMRSSSAGAIVESVLAVAMNITRERSNDTST